MFPFPISNVNLTRLLFEFIVKSSIFSTTSFIVRDVVVADTFRFPLNLGGKF